MREPHLTTNLSLGLNPFRRSERDAEAEFPCPLTGSKRSQEVTVLMSAGDPEADIIGERIETSLLSPGFHLEASCFLPVAAWV